MSNFERKEEVDLQQQKLEGDAIYNENLEWLREQEARNLGDKTLIRHGDSCTYTNFGLDDAIPAGLPLAIGAKDFKKKFENCKYHEEAFSTWIWSGSKTHDLSPKLATEKQMVDMYNNLKAFLEGQDRSESNREYVFESD